MIVWLIGFFLFWLGVSVGSFLNVCIYRLPREERVSFSRSRCPHCKHTIAWYDNIPLVSYFVLGTKCRHCKKRISFRYPFVELITGIVFVGFFLYYGLNIFWVSYTLLACLLIIATFIDIDFRIIPDVITLGGCVVGLVLSFSFPALQGGVSPWKGLLYSGWGLFFGGFIIYITGLFGDWLFKKESMGGGDVKFLAMMGAFLGAPQAFLIFFLAPFAGAVIGIIQKIRTGESTIPYGPFLSAGCVVTVFFYYDIIYKLGIWPLFEWLNPIRYIP